MLVYLIKAFLVYCVALRIYRFADSIWRSP